MRGPSSYLRPSRRCNEIGNRIGEGLLPLLLLWNFHRKSAYRILTTAILLQIPVIVCSDPVQIGPNYAAINVRTHRLTEETLYTAWPIGRMLSDRTVLQSLAY